MFFGVMNFGQIQKIRLVVVKNFWSNSNQFLVILIRSSELVSYFLCLQPKAFVTITSNTFTLQHYTTLKNIDFSLMLLNRCTLFVVQGHPVKTITDGINKM